MKSINAGPAPQIILLLLCVNLLFFLTLLLIKIKYAVFFSACLSVLLLIGSFKIIVNYNSLILFSIAILINGALFLCLIIKFNSRLATETSINELSIEEISEECNILQNQYKKNKEKNISYKSELEKMEKMSITAFLLGSSTDEKETADHLVNEAVQIMGVEKALFSKYNSDDNKFYVFTETGYKNINNKLTDTVDDWIKDSKLPVLINNVKMETKINVRRFSDFSSAASIIAAPIQVAGEVYGVLRVEHENPGHFTNENLRVLDYISDISSIVFENLYYLRRIEDLARTDGITGLYVHRYMIEKLQDEIQRYYDNNIDISMVMLDIDDFKYYNDTYGHQFGDSILVRIARIIKESIREVDFPVRYGGDEFIIILPRTDIEGAKTLAERLLKKARSTDLKLLSGDIKYDEKKLLTVSLGAGIFKKSYKDHTNFIDKIDMALYRAKHDGKDRIEIIK